MSRPPTGREIRSIARRAVSIFADNGYECCLFGSAACALFGTTRCPNDLDLIVLTTDHAEDLKALLVNANQDFFLVPSRSWNADYEVLWYQLRSQSNEDPRACKVDILVPGILDIPDIPIRYLEYRRRLPLMPLLPLLFMKLKGWTDHRNSNRPDMLEKQHVDVEDINELLEITCDQPTRIDNTNMSWLPEQFVDDAQQRVHEYVETFPESALYWQNLGFAAH